MRPDRAPLAIDAGPTAVQVFCATALVGSCVKMRKWGAIWSATGSPRPVPGAALIRFSVQLTNVPSRVEELLLICRIQLPCEARCLKALSGSWGLNGPVPIPVPGWVAASWMGALALSSKVVPVKLAWGVLPAVPTPVNSLTLVPSGPMRVASRSGSFWC